MSDNHEQSETKHKKHGHGGHGAHGGGHEEGHEGAPEWLISFADMVMLMMGFFVILFALNVQPVGRKPGGTASEQTGAADADGGDAQLLDLAIAIREAFNNPVDMNSVAPQDAQLIKRIRQRAGKSEANDPGTKGRDNDVQSIRPSQYEALCGSIPFAENAREVPASARETLQQIADKVRGMTLIVEVRGHVSALEARQGPEEAMRLASERALAVARELAALGIDWWQLRLTVCADHDRLEAHPAGRETDQANARVEVILTDEVVPDQVPTRYGDPAAPAAAPANPPIARKGMGKSAGH